MPDVAASIAVASDHAGFRYKEEIKTFLRDRGYRVLDFGTTSEEPVDYPGFVRRAAQAVAGGECFAGVVLGGSGNGEAIAANKVPGVRCAVCWNRESARLAKEHNDANLISLGQRMIDLDLALDIVETWLESRFQQGRHRRRIQQLEDPGSC